MRICQIGCGGQATNVYVASLRKLACMQDVEYTACCDTDPSRAESFRAAAGFEKSYMSYESMLEYEKPDAVLIVTPFKVTPVIASDLLKRRIPCLIEKPPAATLDEMQALTDLAKQTQSPHQVAYNRRHMPLIRKLLEMTLHERICTIEYRMHRTNRTESHFETTAVHGFDLVCYLAGERLTRMSATYQQTAEPGVVNTSFVCEFKNGVTALMSFVPMSGFTCEQITVVTDEAYYFTDLPVWNARPDGGRLTRYKDNQAVDTWTDADFADGIQMFESNGFYEQLRAFFDSVRTKRPSPHTLFSACDAALLMECMRTRCESYEPR